VLLVESFVDESQYRGTCYRACGFEAVGLTKGFARARRDFYQEHGVPRQLYLRELRPGASRLLRQARWPEALARHETRQAGPCPFRAPQLENLLGIVSAPGPMRGRRAGGSIASVLPWPVCGGLNPHGRVRLSRLREHLQKIYAAPIARPGLPARGGHGPVCRAQSDSTFQRVLQGVDAGAFASLVGVWLAEQEIGAGRQLAVDGKVLRGRGRQDGRPLPLLSAVTHHLRLTLDQVPIEQKSNEIPALKPLLKKVNPPPGVLITADALHCQQESARFITQELGGDYLFGLKGNQSGILDKAQRLLAPQAFSP